MKKIEKQIENEVEIEEIDGNEGRMSKVKTIIKKHGKKIAVGAAIAASALVGFALKHRHHNVEIEDETDLIEVDDVNSEETEEEN